jgi:hypothetical protein
LRARPHALPKIAEGVRPDEIVVVCPPAALVEGNKVWLDE